MKGKKHMNEIEYLRSIKQEISPKCKQVIEGEEIACSRIDETGKYCRSFAFPAAKWRNGDCPMANDDLRSHEEYAKGKTRVGQQQKQRRKKKNR